MRKCTLIKLNNLILNPQLINEDKLLSIFSKDAFFKITKDTEVVAKFCLNNILREKDILILYPLRSIYLDDFLQDPITFGTIMVFKDYNQAYVRYSYPPFSIAIRDYRTALLHLKSIYCDSIYWEC
jgi:hypothetical protein